ncbi:plasmid recombination protein [Vibrio metschnikovii]|uniref:MobV family relaxase n=1 Tax=Vibrio metschnikovii TaxID=28172 RepID=UPI002FC6459B|nr:plasmid recombination protein [Vibrio metschnikovii]
MINRVSLRHERKKLYQLSQTDAHNYRRENYSRSNIDSERTHLNRVCYRMYDDQSLSIRQMIEKRIEELPPKERPRIVEKGQNQTVVAVELVLQASPEFFEENPVSSEKFEEWVNLNVEHIKQKYKENLLDIVLHLDEKTPHFHINVMPLERAVKNRRRTKQQLKNNESAGTYTVYNFNAKKLFSVNALRRNQDEFAKAVETLGIQRGIKHSKSKHTTIKEYHANIKRFLASNENKIKDKLSFKIEKPRIIKTLLSNSFEDAATYYNRINKQFKQFKSDVKEYVTCIEYALHESRQRASLLSNTIEKLNQICDNDHDLLSTRFDEMKHELDTLRTIEAKLQYQEQTNTQLAQMIATERSERLEAQKELHSHSNKSKSAEKSF